MHTYVCTYVYMPGRHVRINACVHHACMGIVYTYVETALHTDTYHVRRCHAEKFRHHTRNRQVEDPTELAHQVPCLEQQLQGQRVGWLRGAYILYMCHGVCPNVCTYVCILSLWWFCLAKVCRVCARRRSVRAVLSGTVIWEDSLKLIDCFIFFV